MTIHCRFTAAIQVDLSSRFATAQRLITAASKLAEAPLGLAEVATRLVEALAINSITEKARRGRRVIVKRRNLHSEQLADLTNLYFHMAEIPIRFWSKVEEWQRWEVGCFEMLNGDRYRAYASGTRCVIAEKLPGESLWEHINRRTLTRRMLQAAASEFRRAHQFGSGAEPTMAAIFDDVSGSVRRCRSNRPAQKATRSAWGIGLDLVGRAHEFHQSGKSEAATSQSKSGNR